MHEECQRAVNAIKSAEESKTAEFRALYERGVKRQEEINAQLRADLAAARSRVAELESAPTGALARMLAALGGWDRAALKLQRVAKVSDSQRGNHYCLICMLCSGASDPFDPDDDDDPSPRHDPECFIAIARLILGRATSPRGRACGA